MAILAGCASRNVQSSIAATAIFSRDANLTEAKDSAKAYHDRNYSLDIERVAPPAPRSLIRTARPQADRPSISPGNISPIPSASNRHPADPVDITVRGWGLGLPVPFYAISPRHPQRDGLSKVAVGRQFCRGDQSAFQARAPQTPEKLFHERGVRHSRALPYSLQVHARTQPHTRILTLTFRNTGRVGAVLHVYDRLHLDRIPRRYTVEADKTIPDDWLLQADEGRYDL